MLLWHSPSLNPPAEPSALRTGLDYLPALHGHRLETAGQARPEGQHRLPHAFDWALLSKSKSSFRSMAKTYVSKPKQTPPCPGCCSGTGAWVQARSASLVLTASRIKARQCNFAELRCFLVFPVAQIVLPKERALCEKQVPTANRCFADKNCHSPYFST